MVSNRRASRRTRSGVPAAYLVARERTYSGILGRAARMPGVLVFVGFGMRRGGNKRKANGSTHQPNSHSSLHLFEPNPNGGPTSWLLHVGERMGSAAIVRVCPTRNHTPRRAARSA
jgi:hypothetical protein